MKKLSSSKGILETNNSNKRATLKSSSVGCHYETTNNNNITEMCELVNAHALLRSKNSYSHNNSNNVQQPLVQEADEQHTLTHKTKLTKQD